MREISTTEPTRYEILAFRANGESFLIGYSAGSPSRHRLLAAMQKHGQTIITKLGIGENEQITFGTKPRPFAETAGWKIAYTGRTQREVRTAGNEYPFIAA